MAAGSGKVTLVTSSAALSCGSDCDAAAGVRDFVGYGAANDSETAAAPTLSNTTAAIRAAGGATDTDNNSADFAAGTPTPRYCGARVCRRHRRSRRCGSARSTTTTTAPTRARPSRSPAPLASTSPAGASCSTTAAVGRSTAPSRWTACFPTRARGLGAASFPDRSGMQNGAPDGVALVEPGGTVVEFLSYEGCVHRASMVRRRCDIDGHRRDRGRRRLRPASRCN